MAPEGVDTLHQFSWNWCASSCSSCHSPNPPNRGRRSCRAFVGRTLSYVRLSLNRWSYAFSQPTVPFPFHRDYSLKGGCSNLAKAVKSLLADCPSSVPEEVLAFQSIKKGLPDSCRCMESELLSGLVSNIIGGTPPRLPAGYLSFVKKQTRALFPKGWDSTYEGYCRRASPPLKGTLESGRADGGALAGLSDIGHAEFLEVALFGRDFSHPLPSHLEGALQVVQSAGKPRPLTTFSKDGFFLKPLHKTIYSHLSRRNWLLRGDLTDSALKRAGFRSDAGLLTSGDYSSATDNLSIEVMECALEAILEGCVSVPPNVKQFASRACRPWLWESKEDFGAAAETAGLLGKSIGEYSEKSTMKPRKGQMMGSYLSFPFLCLQNYLAFRWATRHHRGRLPVLINGDDILFQSSDSLSREWASVVGGLGLEVERTKTSVERDWGTLNSTLVVWNSEGLLTVRPTLRFGMLKSPDYPNSLGKSFESFLHGISGDLRWRAGRVFFAAHLGQLRETSWSLPSLGFRGSLAHRLARIYGLIGGWRMSGSPPDAPVSHSVVLPPDLVSEVPLEFVDSEIQDLNSAEVASWKWTTGFSSASLTSSAIRWAMASTRWDFGYDEIPALWSSAVSWPDRIFNFRWGRGILSRGVRDRGSSRRSLWNQFKVEPTRRTTCRVHPNIVAECMTRANWFWGPLPTYEEACRR